MDGEVAVARLGLDRVVPVVVARHRQPAFEPARARGEVGVDEDRVERDQREVGVDRAGIETEHDERQQHEATRRDDVDQVEPRSGEPVHRLGRVVHRVEAPQPRHGVERAVDPVLREVGREHAGGELQHQRGLLDGLLQRRDREHRAEAYRGGEHQHADQLDQRVAHEEILGIGQPAGAERALLAAQREHALERHEQRRGGQRTEHEPVKPEIERGFARPADLDAPGAEREREARQRQPGDPERLAAAEQQRKARERERREDRQVDRRAHQLQRIARTQLGERQPLREMEAQHRGHAQQPEDHREHPADPPAAEPPRGRVGEDPRQRPLRPQGHAPPPPPGNRGDARRERAGAQAAGRKSSGTESGLARSLSYRTMKILRL